MNAPPTFSQITAPVSINIELARNTYRLRIEAPAIARSLRPGQFVMVRLPTGADPLLGRPFALYDTVLNDCGDAVAFDIVYLVVGKLTNRLTHLRTGDAVEIWGPLGNGFPAPTKSTGGANMPRTDSEEPYAHVALVAGGIGQTPFLAHTRELLGTRGYGGQAPRRRAHRVSVYYGVRSAELAAGVDDFQAAGAEVYLASNDGSIGFRGLVTDLLDQQARPDHIFGCGPEPMLHALARFAEGKQIPCHLSLETPMACGVGICFSCVTPVKTTEGWDYKRVCVDGPVFDAAQLHWPS